VLVHHAERVLVYPNLGQPLRKSSDKAATFFVVAEAAAGTAPKATTEVVQDGRTVAKAPASLPAPGSSDASSTGFNCRSSSYRRAVR
jgi:hypothetical protein